MSRRQQSPEEMPSEVSGLGGWRPARRRVDVTAAGVPTRRVTIRLDEDVVAIFKAEALAGGLPYQVAINQALRDYLRNRERSERRRAAEIVLEALEDEAVREKLRLIR